MMDAAKPEGVPLKTLINVPIHVPNIEAMSSVLTSHGAALVETLDRTFPCHTGGRRGYKEYTILFPDGTRRVDHEVIRLTMPFTIYFPDGFEMPGKSVYPGHRGPDDPETIILYMPRELARK
jgi:hypothetical protein